MRELILDVFIENTVAYQQDSDADKKKLLDYNAFQIFMDILFLCGSEQGRYGYMVKSYRMKYVNKSEQYPKKLYNIMDIRM